MKPSLGLLSLLCTLWSFAAAAQECKPPCAAGHACIDGMCVPVASTEGATDDAGIDDGLQAADSSSPGVQTFDKGIDDPDFEDRECTRSSQCRASELCIDGTCEDRVDVRDAGTYGFAAAAAFYGMGAGYNSVAPIIGSLTGYVQPYPDDSSSGGFHGFVLAATGPAKAYVVLPGLWCQAAVLKQRRYLRGLGVRDVPNGLFAAGWAFYALAVASSGLNMVAFASEQQGFAVSTSIVNAAILTASFTVSVLEFDQHRKLLRAAVNRADAARDRAGVNVAPYLSLSRDRMGGGVALRF